MLYDYDIINSSSIYAKQKIIEYILSICNKVEFLVQGIIDKSLRNFYDKSFIIFDKALIDVFSGESYNMPGKIYQFKLTDEIKQYFIDRCDITLPIESFERDVMLDNPAFLNGNEYVLTNCSHEGMVDINPEYKKQIEDKYLSFVREDAVYKEIQQKFFNVDRSNFRKEYNILVDLRIYIGNLVCYFINHEHVDCNYNQFLQVANKYFSDELLYHFNHTVDFKGLFFENFEDRYYNELHYLEILALKSNTPFDSDKFIFR